MSLDEHERMARTMISHVHEMFQLVRDLPDTCVMDAVRCEVHGGVPVGERETASLVSLQARWGVGGANARLPTISMARIARWGIRACLTGTFRFLSSTKHLHSMRFSTRVSN